MFRFPKFDFSKFDASKFDRPPRGGPDHDASGPGADRLAERMARFQRVQTEALAKWARTYGQPGASQGPAGSDGTTLDMEAPEAPGGAWTAPRSGQERARAAEPELDLSGLMRTLRAGRPVSRGRPPVAVPPGARFEERVFTGAAGSRRYKVYVPSGYTGQALPLVVMLHGCTQDPDDFAAGTQMNAVAEQQTFLVAYPAQAQTANPQRCWNWYAAGDQAREGGEPELIAGIARAVLAEFSADPSRVYAAGLSAGGAAAAILAATYPDLFAAVGIHSGLACGAARDLPGALAAMKGQAKPARTNRQGVPTIVFHGDGDRTVHPANGDQVMAQAGTDPGLTETVTRDTSPGGIAYTRTIRSDAGGRPVQEQWLLHGAGHAWSGGSPAGSYTEPRGPDASRAMLRFFLSHALEPRART
ncbi:MULTISPECIES: extracellular catalytic domain type 1 short-chain-length polyhydroxyalkanoate depolymerase [unclassified Methylobacterium]|jgi:poly(hydroxyalkanoate) depolymerase family esterase|uniref:extracellular catalytic domain type 1 short-chain-length polyhydroxyalkanoate depolymerase n=1 Tax=unclassified Methylobacterium TaxID=2615210 RepID=UPI00135357E2|nr:PHB depolymerase family esterase [Methylobacterium sp. 2A]MWV21201.1 PHB depolymerase family esterase [Methylobacterium sp. 2A]